MQLFRLFATEKAKWSEFRLTPGRGAVFLFAQDRKERQGAHRAGQRLHTRGK